MKAYRTYLTIKDPDQVILSKLPFRPGQRVEVVILAKDEEQAARVQELRNLFTATQSLPQVQALSEDEILREIKAHRGGQ
jgi:hypothetical protein